MPEAQIRLPAIHAGQRHVEQSPAKYRRICAGRGWRKSSLGLRFAIKSMLQGYAVGWYAPTWRPIAMVEQLFKRAIPPELLEQNKQDGWIGIKGAEKCWFTSLELPDNARGPSYPCLVLDEAGALEDGVRDSVIEPILFKSKGRIIELGTPNPSDPFNDFWAGIENGKDDPNSLSLVCPVVGAEVVNGELVRVPHEFENPEYSFEDLEASWNKARDKRLWRIEYLVEFLEGSGSVFDRVEEACTLPCIDAQPKSGGWYQGGIDIGKENDWTVISVLDCASMRMVYFRRIKGCAWETIYGEIARAVELYPGKYYVDSTGMGSHIPETMGKRGVSLIPVVFSNQMKAKLLEHLAYLIESGRIKLWKFTEIVSELKMLQRTMTASGNERLAAPKKMHDDIPMSLALAAQGLGQYIDMVVDSPDNQLQIGDVSDFCSVTW